jgi:hypothetical protein
MNIAREEETLLTSDDVNIKMVPLISWLRLSKLQAIILTSCFLFRLRVCLIYSWEQEYNERTVLVFSQHTLFLVKVQIDITIFKINSTKSCMFYKIHRDSYKFQLTKGSVLLAFLFLRILYLNQMWEQNLVGNRNASNTISQQSLF